MGNSAAKSVGVSVNGSNSKFEAFDYPLDTNNRDAVCTHLKQIEDPIVAIWIVSRPLHFKKESTFQHWGVIIEGGASLILLEFLEHGNKGAFRLKARNAVDAEFHDFFYWQPADESQAVQKFGIVVSVTPSPLRQGKYAQLIDDDETQKIAQQIKKQKKAFKAHQKLQKQQKRGKHVQDSNDANAADVQQTEQEDVKHEYDEDEQPKQIKCNKTIADIAEFLMRWTELSDTKSDDKKKKDKPYNLLVYNCQQFAVNLFEDIVGEQYAEKVAYASKKAAISPQKVNSPTSKSKESELY
eukprot:CAMPEP_0197037756 /NCGR_PEP_ID=MMETSP1384-20130603/14886_1 /TAXON_ID=29189 /ORGANISM="Ammonia sp." /LENGTH=296 /DNA_ID=CAMNT_0042468103 /DNA_START=17 /DNA_END=907 /DNA_ORIENTATION=-